MLGLELLRDGTSTENELSAWTIALAVFWPRGASSARLYSRFSALSAMEEICQATSLKILDGLFACLKLGESSVTSALAMPC